MTVDQFVKKVTVNPERDIKPVLSLVKRYEVDTGKVGRACLHCGDGPNNHDFPSAPWTRVQYCWLCKSINVVYFTDRMGGTSLDTVEVYQVKEPSAFEKAIESVIQQPIKTRKIGVLSFNYQTFQAFVQEDSERVLQIEGFKLTFSSTQRVAVVTDGKTFLFEYMVISDMDRVRGYEFHEVVETGKFWERNDARTLRAAAIQRIRK